MIWVVCAENEGAVQVYGPMWFEDEVEWEMNLPDCTNAHMRLDTPSDDVAHTLDPDKMDIRCPERYLLSDKRDRFIIAQAFVGALFGDEVQLRWKYDALIRRDSAQMRHERRPA